MHQANREAVFAWLDACNRKPQAELLHKSCFRRQQALINARACVIVQDRRFYRKNGANTDVTVYEPKEEIRNQLVAIG